MSRRGCEFFIREISALADLPEAVRATLEPDHPQATIRQLLFFPPQQYLVPDDRVWWRRLSFDQRSTPQRTMLFTDDQIVVVEGAHQPDLRVFAIPIPALVTIRLMSILLYSYLELAWMVAGRIETLRIEFNSVGRGLIEREMCRIRSAIAAQDGPHLALDSAPTLDDLPFKFATYTRLSLLPGERLRAVVYEPKMRQPGKRFAPFISPNRTIALTDQHLILIEDASPRAYRTRAATYHIEQVFCPRHRLYTVTFDDQPHVTWMQLRLGTAQVSHEIPVPVSAAHAAALQTAFADWLPATTAR